MRPTILPIALLVVALLAAPASLAAASVAGPAMQVAITDRAWTAAGEMWALLESSYQRAPALVAVLSALVVLPAMALVSFAVHRSQQRRAYASAVRVAERRAEENPVEEVSPAEIPLWPQQAWLKIEDGSADTMLLAGVLVRLGRHQDNDIRLADRSVHRYHAVIERTTETGFIITDISGKGGNGMRVNGTALARAQLTDGDVIELGRTRLKFESAPI